MSKPLIVANWKMHKTLPEAVTYVQQVGEALHQLAEVEVVICPAFIALPLVEGLLRGTRVGLGVQNVAAWKQGAYTGEVAASMLAGLCGSAIIGHSERRRLCGETPELVNSKIQRCVESQIQPIVCISSEQELEALEEVREMVASWIVAYEPLEAIGSGKASDPAKEEAMAKMIRQRLGRQTRVLYGGSVDAGNVRTFLRVCDGVLVGTASWDPQEFLALCQAAAK